MRGVVRDGPSKFASVTVEQARTAGDHLNRPCPGELVSPNDQLPSGSVA